MRWTAILKSVFVYYQSLGTFVGCYKINMSEAEVTNVSKLYGTITIVYLFYSKNKSKYYDDNYLKQ